MSLEDVVLFEPFLLDRGNQCLWWGEQLVTVPPKAFAMLRYLVEHAGQLVTKDELLRAVWPEAVVGDAVLKVYIADLRKALADDPKAPRFIETVQRRGYRFIAPLTTTQPVVSSQHSVVSSQPSHPAPSTQHPPPSLVGRDAELTQLQQALAKALRGERQVVFVTGEAGIGKTTLVDALLGQVATTGELWVAHGQCIEHYGVGEAYLPILEALGRLCRVPGGDYFIPLLRQHAPTWLVQMPALLTVADREALQREVVGATRERMLREMAEALEVLAADRLLVLRLEDLQWSDYATLDLLSVLGRRRETTRLVVIGTYRPGDVILGGHPLKALKQELDIHGQSVERKLELLSEQAVEQYLTVRFPRGQFPTALVRVIHERTDGNPLFMVNVVDSLVAQGIIVKQNGYWQLRAGMDVVEVKVPESLRQMIEQQIERLSVKEQRVLEVASVAGVEFSTAAVAATAETDVVQVEERCEELARRACFLRPGGIGEWPDGTVAARYGFTHALYQNVLYERVGAARRLRLHQRIGEREEVAYGERVREIAAELAMHFEQGRDYGRAVKYLQYAAKTATQRSANREAISLLTKGLALLKLLPDTPERTQQELRLQLTLGVPLMATKGYAAPEVEHAYARARELCQHVGETPQLFMALLGLWGFYLVRAELQTAQGLAEQGLHLAQRANHPTALLAAHLGLGTILYYLGELTAARAHLEQGMTLYDPQTHRLDRSPAFVQDPGVNSLTYGAHVLWLLGYPDQALKKSREARALAQELAHPFSSAYALNYAAALHGLRRERPVTREQAEAAVALSTGHGFPLWAAMGTILRNWALDEQGQGEGGIAQVRQGLAVFRATGAELGRPFFLALLAEAYGKQGQAEEGLSVLTEALAAVHKNGERFYEAELYRLKGELLLKGSMRGAEYREEQGAS